MNHPESIDRIRQVAIVLTSVDATTARQLLSQLPSDQARRVRHRMANLGKVTPEERRRAIESFAQLRQGHGASPKPSPRSREGEPAHSPAEALLSSVPSGMDRIEITSASMLPRQVDHSFSDGVSRDREQDDGFEPVRGGERPPFQRPAWRPAWQQWSGEEIARLLLKERPSVIAAVLLQAPAGLGARILQSLPAELMTAVLAALPQLNTTDPEALQEIYDLLHRRLEDFYLQTNADNAGMLKLQAIIAAVPEVYREQIENGLATTHPLLAHSLGFNATAKPLEEVSSLRSSPAPGVAESAAVPAAAAPSVRMSGKGGSTAAEDTADVANVIPLPVATTGGDDSSRTEEAQAFTFEGLQILAQDDLAIVLRSVDPQTILLALVSASPEMRTRIESMIDRRDLARLRSRIASLKSSKPVEQREAQDKIASAAARLLQQGRIATLANVSFVAAA